MPLVIDTFELQKAVFVKLGTALGGIAPVLDNVPEGQAFPYVVLGQGTEEPFDADDIAGKEITLELHSWSRYKGMKELRLMMDTVKEALHDQEITVTGQRVVLALWEYAGHFVDPDDGLTRHGVQRFRFITLGA